MSTIPIFTEFSVKVIHSISGFHTKINRRLINIEPFTA